MRSGTEAVRKARLPLCHGDPSVGGDGEGKEVGGVGYAVSVIVAVMLEMLWRTGR
jgi:hypothetical protein